MREVHRRIAIQPRGQLHRTADGRLRPANGEQDIADIWAEQKRIRLREAIEKDQRRADKKTKRRLRRTADGTKEIEIKISMPKINLRPAVERIRQVRLTSRQKWALLVTVVCVLLVVVAPAGYRITHGSNTKQATSQNRTSAAAVSGAAIGGSKPDFTTVLPEGKTIDKLGGWGRVSPPDKDPVFAYSDVLAGVHIVVSEQALPENFAGDLEHHLADVAKQFNATTKLTTATASTAYLGTAANGAQSVIVSKNGLLILARSTTKIIDSQWVNYIDSLQ